MVLYWRYYSTDPNSPRGKTQKMTEILQAESRKYVFDIKLYFNLVSREKIPGCVPEFPHKKCMSLLIQLL